MSARLTAAVLVSALIRQTESLGGSGMVLAKGDATAGAVLIATMERGVPQGLLERSLDAAGTYRWHPVGPAGATDPAAQADYIDRRRRSDPDIWIVELDGRGVAAAIADLIGA